MNTKKLLIILLMFVLTMSFTLGLAQAEKLKIAIMQDKKGAAAKYKPLVPYFKQKGIDVSFVGTPDYTTAAKMFADGKADAMFSGSGVAGSMIIKNVANPIARPLGKKGTSTYWAVILAPKGSPKYAGSADYFSGKQVIYCSLASSGEIYFRSIGGHTTAKKMMKAASHGAAIDALARGKADFAIVKNRVWDKMKNKYPGLEVVGNDTGENPNGTLILSKKTPSSLAGKVSSALIGLMEDPSSEAKAVRDQMNVMGYIKTTNDDFSHTLNLLKNAGVDKRFAFEF